MHGMIVFMNLIWITCSFVVSHWAGDWVWAWKGLQTDLHATCIMDPHCIRRERTSTRMHWTLSIMRNRPLLPVPGNNADQNKGKLVEECPWNHLNDIYVAKLQVVFRPGTKSRTRPRVNEIELTLKHSKSSIWMNLSWSWRMHAVELNTYRAHYVRLRLMKSDNNTWVDELSSQNMFQET